MSHDSTSPSSGDYTQSLHATSSFSSEGALRRLAGAHSWWAASYAASKQVHRENYAQAARRVTSSPELDAPRPVPPPHASSSSPQAAALRTLDEPVQRRPPVSIRTIIMAISGVGFVGGLGGAFLYMMRKGRIEAAREAQAAASAGLHQGSSRLVARESSVARGLTKGGTKTPVIVQGRPVGTSIFDGDATTPPPFALRKVPVQASAVESSQASVASDNSKSPSSDDEEANGPFLAIKAFGIATAMVGFVSLLTAEICRRLFRIKDLDDLVEKLRRITPENRSAAGAYDTEPGQPMLEEKDFADHMEEAMGALGQAESVEEWFRILKRTLDTERQAEVAERWQRVRLREVEGQAGV